LKSVLSLFGVCLLVPSLFASEGPPPDVAKQAKAAQRVVVATISEVHTSFARNEHGDQLIMSRLVLDVAETLKGPDATLLSVDIEGGTVGELTLRVSDMPQVERGERAVFFLDRSGPDQHLPHGRGLGVLKLDGNDRVRGSDMSLAAVRTAVTSAIR
jgi:hypothetical protein